MSKSLVIEIENDNTPQNDLRVLRKLLTAIKQVIPDAAVLPGNSDLGGKKVSFSFTDGYGHVYDTNGKAKIIKINRRPKKRNKG